FDVETDFEIVADGFHGGFDFGENLVFAFVEEAIPHHDFGKLREDAPELDEVAVGRALIFERGLDELIEARVAGASAFEINAGGFGGALMIFAKASDARRSDGLGMTGAEGVEERAVAFVEKKNAVDVVRLAKISGEAGP